MTITDHGRARAVMRIRRFALAATVCACALAIPLAGAAHASVITVTNTADSGAGSLRAALAAAKPGDTISIPTPGDYLVTSAELVVTKDVSIEGSGPAVRIVGDGNNRVFDVTANNASLSGLTVTGGGLSGASAAGGGIANGAGTLVLRDVTVTGNTVSNTSGGILEGGGVSNKTGTLEIIDSTISGNTAAITPGGGGIPGGGGVASSEGSVSISGSTISGNTASIAMPGGVPEGGGIESIRGSLTIADSTLSGNKAIGGSVAQGGAIVAFFTTTTLAGTTLSANAATESGAGTVSQGGGILQFQGSLSLVNSTIAANTATAEHSEGGGVEAEETTAQMTNATIASNVADGPNGVGGNLLSSREATVALQNTIVASGTAASGPNCAVAPKSAIQSQGHNLDSLNDCGFTAAGDIVGADPLLAPLADNGGATQTMALAPTSPAIDAAASAACPATDQRGVLRPAGTGCDIGAFELATPSATSGQASAVTTTSATLNGSGANPDLAGASTFFQYGTTGAYGSLTPAQAIGPTTAQAAIAASVGGLRPGTLYHFRLVVQNGVSTAYGADQTFTTSAPPAAGPGPSNAPTVSGASQSHAVWRGGKKLAVLSRRSKRKAPVGTTFSFTLDQVATARFVFAQQVGGRSVKGRCVAPSKKNRRRHACKRTILRGTLSLAAHSGLNKLAFQGQLSRSKRLPPGRYMVLISATNAVGKRSATRALRFTIVR
jgi:hypothetical protein